MAYTTVVAGTAITASWANASVRDQGVSVHADTTARDAAITAPVGGMVAVTTDTYSLWLRGSGAWVQVGPLAGWTTYTPTVVQSGTATTTATDVKYMRAGRHIWYRGIITVSAAGGAAGGNKITVSLPVTAIASLPADTHLGVGFVYNAVNTGAAVGDYPGICRLDSSTTLHLVRADVTGAGTHLGASGFTEALNTNDIISFHVTFEAAA